MGKNSERKSLKRKEEKIRLKEAEASVQKANEVENPLAEFTAFHVFDKNGIKAKVEYYSINNISDEMFNEIFQMEKENMENLYNSCLWGWNEKKKWREMREETAKYLVVKSEQNEIIAFSHFRFDMDYGNEVLYCYELQLKAIVQRKGLGKFLLQLLELIAFKNRMRKVVLTVLKHNLPAVNFFYSLKYELDDTNPEESIFEEIPYQILSKKNKRLPPWEETN